MATILIVDDSPTARAFMAKVLGEQGHECLEASNGAEAVALAKEHRPALVLLDIVMGEQDGFRACRRIKRDAATRDIPVVFVTCKTGETDEMWGRRMGAEEYLRKPVTPDALLETVARFVPQP